MRPRTLAALAVVVAGAAGCGTTAPLTFPALLPGGGFAAGSPASVVATATSAAAGQGSVRIVAVSGSARQRVVSVYDVAGDHGKQTIAGDEGSGSISVVGGAAYQRADATYLQQSENFPAQLATRYAGQWISFRPGQPGFEVVSAGDTLSSALAEVTPTGPLRTIGLGTADGQPAVEVAGSNPAAAGPGTEVLYVALAAPHLPIKAVQRFPGTGGVTLNTETFSNWGEAVSVTAPARAIPITSVIAGG
ncbi:MAG TPA: hypothetical protein VKU91_07650 [Acidimicrobiales bacterium]|nr:hypothetical protein [Acidimicrobiales bacterium]